MLGKYIYMYMCKEFIGELSEPTYIMYMHMFIYE